MINCSACIARLTDKDAVSACAYAQQIVAESRKSDCWYPFFNAFAELLRHKNALVRNRALAILSANARWDCENQLDALLDELLLHVTDEKPVTARKCIQVLPEIAAANHNLVPRIRSALETADLSGYRDSMRPLISKDIAAALKEMEGKLP